MQLPPRPPQKPIKASESQNRRRGEGIQGKVQTGHHGFQRPSSDFLLVHLLATGFSDWQEEIETQRQQHEARVMSIRTEEKQKMDKMADDLEQKWRDALR